MGTPLPRGGRCAEAARGGPAAGAGACFPRRSAEPATGATAEAARQGQQESTAEASPEGADPAAGDLWARCAEPTGAVPGLGAGGTMLPPGPDALCAPPPQRCRRRWPKWKVGCGNSSQNQRRLNEVVGNTPRLVRVNGMHVVQKEEVLRHEIIVKTILKAFSV